MKIKDPQSIKGFIQPTSQQAGKTNSQSQEPLLSRLELVPGQIIKGTVIKITADSTVQLAIEGEIISVRSQVPLKQGEELLLEIRKGGDVPLLTKAGQKGAILEFVKVVLGSNVNPAKLFNQFISLRNEGGTTTLSDSILPLVDQVEKGMTQSLIGGESSPEKLLRLLSWFGNTAGINQADSGKLSPALKLPALIEELLSPNMIKGATLKEELTQLLKVFQGMQNINQQSGGHEQPDIFLYPCFFAGEAGWGEWFSAFHNKKGQQAEGENDAYTLAFYLKMSSLGDLSLQLTMQSDSLTGQFQFESESKKEYVQSRLPDLVNSLRDYGLNRVSFSCQVAKNNVKQTWLNALADCAHLKELSVLDITV